MLNIEAVCDDLILFLRQRYPAQLDTVVAMNGTRVPVAPPQASSYYLGEWSRYRSYDLPAVFVVPSRSPRAPDGQNIDKWNHSILVDYLVSGHEEEQLTRACFRHAEAAYACLHEQDITRAGVATRGTKVFVETVDYGPMIASQQAERVFRKDIFLTLRILHYDTATPVG